MLQEIDLLQPSVVSRDIAYATTVEERNHASWKMWRWRCECADKRGVPHPKPNEDVAAHIAMIRSRRCEEIVQCKCHECGEQITAKLRSLKLAKKQGRGLYCGKCKRTGSRKGVNGVRKLQQRTK